MAERFVYVAMNMRGEALGLALPNRRRAGDGIGF
jgi:hypothetical protein